MLVLICGDHLLNDLLDVLACSFNCPIHLGSIRRSVVMFNLEAFTQFFHHPIIQVRAIVSDNLVGNSIPIDNVVLDETDDNLLGHIHVRCHLYPLCEVVNCHKDEAVSIRGLGLYHSNDINSPHRGRPWRGDNIEQSWRFVNLVSINLTLWHFFTNL